MRTANTLSTRPGTSLLKEFQARVSVYHSPGACFLNKNGYPFGEANLPFPLVAATLARCNIVVQFSVQ